MGHKTHWLETDTVRQVTALTIKKAVHPNAEDCRTPYLEGSTLYITEQTFEGADTFCFGDGWTLPPCLEDDSEVRIDVFVARLILVCRECEIHFTALSKSAALECERQCLTGMNSDCSEFEIMVNDCIRIQAMMIATDAYGQDGFFDIIKSPDPSERLTNTSALHFGDADCQTSALINSDLLAKHYPQHYTYTNDREERK